MYGTKIITNSTKIPSSSVMFKHDLSSSSSKYHYDSFDLQKMYI